MRSTGLEPPRAVKPTRPSTSYADGRCFQGRARGAIEPHLPETMQRSVDPAERELLNRYVAAFERADMDGLVALLREDATLRMPPQPTLVGGPEIAQFFHETVAGGDLTRIRHRPVWANGRPAVTIEMRGEDHLGSHTESACSRSTTVRSLGSKLSSTLRCYRDSESRPFARQRHDHDARAPLTSRLATELKV